jgi:eukaryotic-like serine/threonine-protein kinase
MLEGAPIEARRDSVTYVLRTQLRRHRAVALAALAFAALVLLALGVTFTLWRSSERNRQRAEENFAQARRESDRAVRVTNLFASLFHSVNPDRGGDHTLTAKEMLDRGAERTLSKLKDDPIAEADLLTVLGSTYVNINDVERGIELLTRAHDLRTRTHGRESRQFAEVSRLLGEAHRYIGKHDIAERYYRQAYDAVRARLLPDDVHIVLALVDYARTRREMGGMESVIREALERTPAEGAWVGRRLSLLNSLGESLDVQGRGHEAIAPMREAVELARGTGPMLATYALAAENNLAWLLLHSGELAEAKAVAEKALEERRRLLPPGHLEIASSCYVLGRVLLKGGDKPGAEPLLAEALRLRESALPEADPRVTDAREALAECR